jgi:excisionase family DNA binding protein
MESLLCTVAECAALLHVSVDTIRRSIRAGVIPCKRLRTNIRISRAWIEAYSAESAPVLLTRKQVAAKLGVSACSVDTLRRKGLLPTIKIEGRAMILVSAVNEYLKRNQFAFLRAKPGSKRPASWALAHS